jgi:hypothetical protein
LLLFHTLPMSSLKDPLLPTEEKVAPAPSAQPPSYQVAAEAPAPPAPGPPEHDEHGHPKRCRRRCRRFGHFLAAAFLLWLAARFIVRHCELRRMGPPHHPGHFPWGPGRGDHEGHHHHHPPGKIDSCVDSADWAEFDPGERHFPHRPDVWRRTELSLPSSSDDIFLFSQGFNAIGLLNVVEAPDRDDIGVEVIVGSGDDELLFESTKVCTFRRQDNGHGVGILTPPHRPHHHDRGVLFFNITVLLPERKDITVVPHFETHLPAFHHVISKLPTHTFGSFSLHSLDSPIFVESLVGDKISIRSTNGPIAGSFNTSHSLDIKTRNAPVDVTVHAFNDDSRHPTKVKIHTSNSVLFARLALISTHEEHTGGSFLVHARTSNSPLRLDFTDQAPDSQLRLEAHTTNAPAYVHLHPSFEGLFKAQTTILPAVVAPDENVADPAGRDRTRRVDVKRIGRGGRIVHGEVAWIPQDKVVAPAGRVEISTTHSPLHLFL